MSQSQQCHLIMDIAGTVPAKAGYTAFYPAGNVNQVYIAGTPITSANGDAKWTSYSRSASGIFLIRI